MKRQREIKGTLPDKRKNGKHVATVRGRLLGALVELKLPESPLCCPFLCLRHMFGKSGHWVTIKANADIDEDLYISPNPLSLVLYSEETNKYRAVHIPGRRLSVALWKYIIKRNGTVISTEDNIHRILFKQMEEIKTDCIADADDILVTFEDNIWNQIVCFFYLQTDDCRSKKKNQPCAYPSPPDTLISFSTFPHVLDELSDDFLSALKGLYRDPASDEKSFCKSLNVVYINGGAATSFHFPQHVLSVAVADVLMSLHGFNCNTGEDLIFHDLKWSGGGGGKEDYVAGSIDGTLSHVATNGMLCDFFHEIAYTYPQNKMENVTMVSRKAKHNVIFSVDL